MFYSISLCIFFVIYRIIFPTPLPPHLQITDIRDTQFDKKAVEEGKKHEFTDEQMEGQNFRSKDEFQGYSNLHMSVFL